MRVEFVNPFISSAIEVFQTMFSCDLKRGELSLKQNHSPEHEVSGLIGLSGRCQGMVVVSLERAAAIRAAEAMLGERPDELNADVADAVGEVTNMIAGSAKAKLAEYQLTIGLPTVICGKHHIVSFPSKSKPIAISFDSKLGSICIEVGLVELLEPLPA